jgi:hypothetical protein
VLRHGCILLLRNGDETPRTWYSTSFPLVGYALQLRAWRTTFRSSQALRSRSLRSAAFGTRNGCQSTRVLTMESPRAASKAVAAESHHASTSYSRSGVRVVAATVSVSRARPAPDDVIICSGCQMGITYRKPRTRPLPRARHAQGLRVLGEISASRRPRHAVWRTSSIATTPP